MPFSPFSVYLLFMYVLPYSFTLCIALQLMPYAYTC